MRRRMPVARLVFFAHLLLVNYLQAKQMNDNNNNHTVSERLLNDKGQIQVGYRSFLKFQNLYLQNRIRLFNNDLKIGRSVNKKKVRKS